MTAVMVIAGVVVLAVTVAVARGRGGELSVERGDYAPLDLGRVSATDVVVLRPPAAMWGYDIRATNEAMERIAQSIMDRDVRIAALEQLVTDLSRESVPQSLASPYAAARHRRPAPDDGGAALVAPSAEPGSPGHDGGGPPEQSHD